MLREHSQRYYSHSRIQDSDNNVVWEDNPPKETYISLLGEAIDSCNNISGFEVRHVVEKHHCEER